MTFREFRRGLKKMGSWYTSGHRIRARSATGTEGCPITTRAYVETGHYYSVGKWAPAARALGLGPRVATFIVAAADTQHPRTATARAYRRSLRRLLNG